MREKICPECGAAFMPRKGSQVCCSDKCQAARTKRQKKLQDAKRCLYRDQTTEIAFRKARRDQARRRAAFFAARDAAFERAGLPIPKIEVRNGVRIESRGVIAGRPSGKSSLQISSKSYYYR